jgi:pimeloyl-ACP methyl ester carboxylesterase
MTALAYTRAGAGAPLVLLHGIGSSRHAWDPVLPALTGRFDVIAVDLPGFGGSGPVPPEVERPFHITITPGYARMAIRALGTCPGFGPTMRATVRPYRAGPPIVAPVTVAFGSRDLVLLRHQSRHLGELPPGTRLETLSRCGHVPMADDPGAVTALITAASARWAPGREPSGPPAPATRVS